MNDTAKQWLEQLAWREGFLAAGLRLADGSGCAKTRGPGYTSEAAEEAARISGEILFLLDKHHLNYGRACLVFHAALLHAERRPDGLALAIITTRDVKTYDAAGLEKLFAEFKELQLAAP